MASAKPPRRPAFDAKTFTTRLWERVLTAAGKPYAIFDPADDSGQPINFPRWVQWIDKLRDTVNANAIYQDDEAGRLTQHITTDDARHARLVNRVTALEEAASFVPFGVSGSTGA